MAGDEALTVATGERESSRKAPRVLAGRYELRALLGTGGMGSVFVARDRVLDELVAVKLLNDAESVKVRDEVRLARSVTHRNVARTYDIGEDDGKFLTMEYIAGESLAHKLTRVGCLPFDDCVRVGSAICEGLAAAHDAGVIHRDLKPANVMLASDGRVVIMDFGVAIRRDTSSSTVAGTPRYMAPEQLAGKPLDGRCDLYALGALLYRMSTGRRAFEDATSDLSPADPCERQSLPSAFGKLVVRCLAANPQERFADARETLAALRALPAHDDAPPATDRGTTLHLESAPRVIAVALEGPDHGPVARGLRDALVEGLRDHTGVRITDDGGEAEARVGVTVQLVAARLRMAVDIVSQGLRFWSGEFEDSVDNLLSLAATALAAVATALAVDIHSEALVDPIPAGEVEAFLKAREDVRSNAVSRLVRSEEVLAKLTGALPAHPLLAALHALARTRLAFFGMAPLDAALSTARNALAGAPGLAEAHLAYGTALWQAGHGSEAARVFAAGVRCAPGNADLQCDLGRLLAEAGSPARGIALLSSAVQRVPSFHMASLELLRTELVLGRMDRARAIFERLPPNTPFVELAQVFFVRAAAWRHDAAAIRAILRSTQFDTSRAPGAFVPIVVAVAVEGRAPRTHAKAAEVALTGRETPRRLVLEHQLWAELAAIGGDYAFAMERIEAAAAAGLHDILWLDRCPLFDDLLGLPSFERVRSVVRERTRAVLEASA